MYTNYVLKHFFFQLKYPNAKGFVLNTIFKQIRSTVIIDIVICNF